MEFEIKAGVAYPGVIQTGSSPNLDMKGEGRTEDIYSLPKDSTNSLESRPATRLVAFLMSLREGGTFHRATSASKKDGLAALLPLPSLFAATLPT
jgi:predicted ArsR family transcriptional regulator